MRYGRYPSGNQKVENVEQERRLDDGEADRERVVQSRHRPDAPVEVEPSLAGAHRKSDHQEGDERVPVGRRGRHHGSITARVDRDEDEPEEQHLADEDRSVLERSANQVRKTSADDAGNHE